MFDHYKNIFNQRGAAYHAAMMEVPAARRSEFEMALSRLDPGRGMRILDVPSGGGYLQDYLNLSDMELVCVETSEAFARTAEGHQHNVVLCDRLDQIPLPAHSVDRVLSLAGVHHLESKPAFYREAARLLHPDDVFCLADVFKGSPVADFLNGFVDQHNSMGHQGNFLTKDAQNEIEECGFRIETAELVEYQWRFRDRKEMARYCSLLFGLDQADETTIIDGIDSILGFEESPSGCNMNWSLYFIRALR